MTADSPTTKTDLLKNESPESIPSMADTSAGSPSLSPEDENRDLDDKVDKQEGSPVKSRRLFFDSEAISCASSETTVVASWNLSHHKNTPESSDEETAPENLPSLLSPPSPLHAKKDDATETLDPEVPSAPVPEMVEETPEAATTCHSAMNPMQLAGIFVNFQGHSGLWSPRKDTDTTTPSSTTNHQSISCSPSDEEADDLDHPSKHREELLRRECAALKKIIEEDSLKILNLQKAMQTQQEAHALQDLEMEDKELELDIANRRIDSIKREKEVMREREAELKETIQILKNEVDKLLIPSLNSDGLLEETPVAKLEGETSKAFQDTANEATLIEDLRKEVQRLQQENVALRSKLDSMTNAEDNEDSCNDMAMAEVNPELASILQQIVKRLEVVEQEKRETETRFIDALERKDAQMEVIRDTLIRGMGDSRRLSQDPDEIEVCLSPATSASSTKAKHPRRQVQDKEVRDDSCCCDSTSCDAWSAMAGDLE